MKNMIEKSVIEGKLAELEQELLALEEAFKTKISIDKMEQNILDDASQIDQHLTEIISCLEETNQKNIKYHSHASYFPIAATNI